MSVGWLVALVYSPLYSFSMNVNLQTTNSFGVIFFLVCGWFMRRIVLLSYFIEKGKFRKISLLGEEKEKKSFHLIIWLTHCIMSVCS